VSESKCASACGRCLYLFRSVCLCVSCLLSVCPSVCLSVCLSSVVCGLSASISPLSVTPRLCLSPSLSLCPSLSLSFLSLSLRLHHSLCASSLSFSLSLSPCSLPALRFRLRFRHRLTDFSLTTIPAAAVHHHHHQVLGSPAVGAVQREGHHTIAGRRAAWRQERPDPHRDVQPADQGFHGGALRKHEDHERSQRPARHQPLGAQGRGEVKR
jgi:hypothetical protein